MRRQLERCVAYAREREQFGQPIGAFQAVSHPIADMRLRLETSRLMLYRIARLLEAGTATDLDAALTKLHLSESLVAVEPRRAADPRRLRLHDRVRARARRPRRARQPDLLAAPRRCSATSSRATSGCERDDPRPSVRRRASATATRSRCVDGDRDADLRRARRARPTASPHALADHGVRPGRSRRPAAREVARGGGRHLRRSLKAGAAYVPLDDQAPVAPAGLHRPRRGHPLSRQLGRARAWPWAARSRRAARARDRRGE